jgi:hypothetical protein
MTKELPAPNRFLTLGGRVECIQCQATSRRTLEQCRAPAVQGQRVCRFHGGLSKGPTTSEGRQRCAQARTVHGEETAAKRKERSRASARLATLEAMGHVLGMMADSKKTPGRKPNSAEIACPELLGLLRGLN